MLAAEKRTVSKLLAPSKQSEKTYTIDEHIICLVSGLTADANILVNEARLGAQRYLYQYQAPIPLEYSVKDVCNYKQSYTQYGGLRPFGVAFLFAGWDKNFGYQLYQSDPSGNYSGWKATVIGQNNQAGKSLLKTDYKEDSNVQSNLKLAVKILLKTMDASTPSPEKIELSSITKNADGKIQHVIVSDQIVQTYINEITAEEEAEKKAKEASQGDI